MRGIENNGRNLTVSGKYETIASRSKDRMNRRMENKTMSTTEKTAEQIAAEKAATIEKGLQIRKFDGKIAEDKEKKTPEVKYVYERIVLPWSRTGKDVDGKDVTGAVPSLSELLAFAQTAGFTTEFKLDKENNPEGPSVVGFLIDGINSYFNRTSRIKAENTPESAKEKALQVFMSKTGMNRETALKTLATMFAQ